MEYFTEEDKVSRKNTKFNSKYDIILKSFIDSHEQVRRIKVESGKTRNAMYAAMKRIILREKLKMDIFIRIGNIVYLIKID